MKQTIYTIANQAGVSIATVSRALNGSSRVNEETRARILQIAKDLGYQPSASARSLAMNTTETLALVLPHVSGPYFSELIRGAESVSRLNHYHLLIYSSTDLGGGDALLPLLSTRTDGMILGTHFTTDDYIHQLYRDKFPFVLLGQTVPNLPINTVCPDNQAGAYQLTRHLIEQHDFRKVGFIAGPENQNHSRERLAGYRQALQEYGIAAQPEWIVSGNFDESSGYASAQQLLALPHPPQAIFAANDQMAIGALAAARTAGYSIPDDLAIVGFDDIPSAQYLQPPLTTVSLAIFDQGVKAMQQLLECIKHPELSPQAITIATFLMVRRSCGCYPEPTDG